LSIVCAHRATGMLTSSLVCDTLEEKGRSVPGASASASSLRGGEA